MGQIAQIVDHVVSGIHGGAHRRFVDVHFVQQMAALAVGQLLLQEHRLHVRFGKTDAFRIRQRCEELVRVAFGGRLVVGGGCHSIGLRIWQNTFIITSSRNTSLFTASAALRPSEQGIDQ